MSSHVAARTGGPLGQNLGRLPFLHAGVVSPGGSLVLPAVNAMQAPKLGREVPADQHVAGAHVPVEQTFTVKELLSVDGETGVGVKHASSGLTEDRLVTSGKTWKVFW